MSRREFLSSADAIRPLLAHPRTGERWDRPSALAHMTVGALAGHLCRAVTSVEAYLGRPEPGPEIALVDAPGYYLSIEGLTGDLMSDLHRGIRARSEEEAGRGQEGVLEHWDGSLGRLRGSLDGERPDRRLPALHGTTLLLDQYLVTRLVEMLVHSDDLAASLGLPLPEFPAAAWDLVEGCLVEMARRRHGRAAVLRALTRRERDDIDALRVL